MIKGFIATVSIAVLMLVCLAANVSAGVYEGGNHGYRGNPYGDYQHEECQRVCYKQRPYCYRGWFARIVGNCWTCCKVKQKYIPYEDEQAMHMEQDHEVQMNQEKSETDAKMD